jgi:hypothetical protein
VRGSLYIKHYNELDEFTLVSSKIVEFQAGKAHEFEWQIPDTSCYPIAFVGIQLEGEQGETGSVYLDYLDWTGEPNVRLNRPAERMVSRLNRDKGPIMWKSAWVDGLDGNERLTQLDYWTEPYRLIQNVGRGLLMQGTREWQNYRVTARMTPHMCEAGGLGIRVQGMTRYYALLITQDTARLIRSHEGKDTTLVSCDQGWKLGHQYELTLQAVENKLTAWLNQEKILEVEDVGQYYPSGAVALISQVGRVGCDFVEVQPAIG